RFAFAWRQDDGTRENLADGSRLNGKDTLALRGALRWQPAPQTTVDLIANWQRDTPPGVAFKSGTIPTTAGDTNPFTAAELNRGRALGIDRTVHGVTGIIAHELNKNWSITSTTGWREYDSVENFDADGSRLYLLEFAEDARGRQFSQEVRANFDDGGRFTGFAGIGYFHETGAARVPFYTDERQLWPFLAGSFRDGLLAAGLPAALVNGAVPPAHPFIAQATLPVTFAAFNNPALPAPLRGLSALAGTPLRPYRADEYTQSGRTRALDVFVDGTWRATNRFELTAGLRVTRESTTSGYEASNGSPPTLGFIVNAIQGYPYLPTAGRREASDTATSWDGRLIGKFEINKAVNAYAGVARGRRPQSILVDSTTTSTAREELVWNYEAGLKGTIGASRLQWSGSVYQYNYAHFQTAVLSLGKFSTVDAGNATGRGLELALQGRASDHVNFFANYGFTAATFDGTSDTGERQAYGGYTFRLTPRHSFSLGGTFTWPVAGVGQYYATPIWSYKSKHYFEDNNAAFNYGLRQEGYGVANLRLGWRSPRGRWEVMAYADNLFDHHHIVDAGNTGGSFGIPTFVAGDPRRMGLQASRYW
ncbi:MAG TPA: TonB-dependent receptor, partial [Opitutaceae bacterium]|nr:TonB-dependent receptor [Opitutaceae bacterium]